MLILVLNRQFVPVCSILSHYFPAKALYPATLIFFIFTGTLPRAFAGDLLYNVRCTVFRVLLAKF